MAAIRLVLSFFVLALLLALPVLAQQPPEERPAMQHYHRGFAFLQQNRLDEALAEYRKALALEPELGVVYAELAVVLALKGNKEAAEESLEKAFQFETRNAGVFKAAAIVHGLFGDEDRAIEDLEKAVALDPAHPHFRTNLAGHYLNRGDHDKAVLHYQEAIHRNPDFSLAHLGLCQALAQAGPTQTEAAVAACARAQVVDPTTAAELRDRAYSAYQRGQMETAVVRARAASLAAPDDAESWELLAAFLAQPGRWQEAVEAGRRALVLNPGSARAHNNVGYSLRQLGKTGEAIAELQAAIRLQPDYALAHHNLGEAYLDKREYAFADAAFRRALEIQPDYGEVRNDLAETHARWGLSLLEDDEIEEAERRFTESLRWEELPSAYAGSCWIGLAEKSFEDAERAAVKALQLDPEYEWGYACRGAVRYLTGNREKALREMQEAVCRGPSDGHLQMALATVLLALGREKEALEAYREAIRLAPSYADARSLEKIRQHPWSAQLQQAAKRLQQLSQPQ